MTCGICGRKSEEPGDLQIVDCSFGGGPTYQVHACGECRHNIEVNGVRA